MLTNRPRLGTVLLAAVPLALLFSVSITRIASAQSLPNWLNYQGRLTTPSGTAVADGQYQVTFRIFDSPTVGNQLWTETKPIACKGGTFATTLGQTVGFPPTLFNQALYLQIEVGNQALLPRQQIGTVAFAMTAYRMPDGSVTSVMLGSSAVTTSKIANGAVTSAKLADSSATTAKIADAAVTGPKLTDASVTTPKLGDASVTTAKLAGGSVTSGKLAVDPAGLSQVSGDALSTNASQNVNLHAERMIGLNPDDSFSFGGRQVGHYSLGWYGDPTNPGGPVGYLSGYGGLRFFTNGTSRMRLSYGGKFYMDNHGWGENPTIDMAIGDNDTGFNWEGDGVIGFYSNGEKVATLSPHAFKVTPGMDKMAVTRTEHYGDRGLYCTEGPEIRLVDQGVSTLRGGETTVRIDPMFVETVDGKPTVHLTAYGDSAIYVSKIGHDRFTVRARKGCKDVSFAWQVNYVRKGYLGRRMEPQKD